MHIPLKTAATTAIATAMLALSKTSRKDCAGSADHPAMVCSYRQIASIDLA